MSADLDSRDVLVQTKGLGKRFGEFQALRDCDLTVHRGEVFGLLGPNGAGKSTLIRLLLGFLRRTEGTIDLLGHDPDTDGKTVRQFVSYLPGDARLPSHMKAKSLLKFFADLHPSGSYQTSLSIAERLELDLSRRVGFMSTGMRQKLALAVVFGVQSPLLILDEPTANLDPSVRSSVLDLVMENREQGQTVILSSHVLSEIEDTCGRVIFLKHGRVAKELAMEDLFQRHRLIGHLNDGHSMDDLNRFRNELPSDMKSRLRFDRLRPSSSPSESQNAGFRLDTEGDLADLLSWLSSLPIHDLRIEPLGLRTVYNDVHLSGEGQSA